MRRRASYTCLAEHPNLDEILAVLAQLAHIHDEELVALASGWRNTAAVAQARRRALSPDTPLVVEVLAAFDTLTALYADDLSGRHPDVRVEPAVTVQALKAVRDAIAAAYARPILSRGQYACLSAPWRTVYPQLDSAEPDLGPLGPQVRHVLRVLPTLAHRCHDDEGRRVYDGLLVTAMTVDEHEHEAALEAAYSAAVASGRRRTWALVRRSAAESLGRLCASCRPSQRERPDERVVMLCADATCGLLVSDVAEPLASSTLTHPLRHLIPLQRSGD